MNYLLVPLLIIIVSLLVVVVISWRKFPYLKRLSVGKEASGEARFWVDLWPELNYHYRQINWAEYRDFWLKEFEKFLRRLRLVSLRLDRLTDALINRVKTSITTGQKLAVSADQELEAVEPITVHRPTNSLTDYKRAERTLIIGIAKDPKNIELYRQLGDIYLAMDNLADARESFQAALRLDSEDSKSKQRSTKGLYRKGSPLPVNRTVVQSPI